MGNITEKDKLFINQAIDLATENVRNGGGPFGAVIVSAGYKKRLCQVGPF